MLVYRYTQDQEPRCCNSRIESHLRARDREIERALLMLDKEPECRCVVSPLL
jgi:hypothetical protein